ncbi:exonuclease domain-containing protein [Flavobacterium sp.]|uniref:exonuclease domain-containing protein n=1 Tax=Flavobacterium sp. TaxID=239 RepID=UPI00286E9EC9|nr:exonuclease domain-containing protein [Flavobacterium sp.]
MYAILDIETTGGQFNEEGITEIAIYKYDGHEIVDQFISLVNPEKPIQPFVVKLTGINNEMLKGAPKFFEIAKRIIEITNGCIFVAHNVSFDYRVLRTEFRRLGYDYNSRNLCTVELSQKLMPEQPSHSLGKLVRALGIPMADRHRATGDALATVKLFKMLLDKDVEKIILNELIKSEVEKGIAPKLRDIMESMPSKTGVYYIYNPNGKLIYIGKSRNIRKRINQHFTGTDKKSLKIQAEAFTVTYEETGSELIALLKESEEIKINKPIYNRAQRKSLFNLALSVEPDEKGYLNLKIQKTDGRRKEITSFSSLSEAKNAMYRITAHYKLCQKLTGLYITKKECFQYKIKECDGACIGAISVEEYNARVQEFINKNSFENQNMIIVDKGRKISEKSVVLIENGVYKGFAFFDLNYQINNPEVLKNIITPMQNNRDVKNILQSHIRKSKFLKIINF